ncbi:hypothetical protein LJC30_06575, partial [Odoribacter sp. OttesenSCG-928-L07]|nr:hypothetical protein [Odoribacter sp. OttesenSCG-928-L07]
LQYILEELSKINHVRAIRIATRVPVVLPMAINDELLELIKTSANKHTIGTDKYVYFMTHINHYHEITEDLANVIKKINKHGFTVRNQTVLLNHVNDYYKTLAETFRRMFWIGVHPYYLLQCHKEKGIVHFITPIQNGKIYMKNFQGWLSGITVPRYAANIEGGGGKVLLMPTGHDTMHLGIGGSIEKNIADSYAMVRTWDGKKIPHYEELGRSTQKEFDDANELMSKFIGRKNVFFPKLIILDDNENYLYTTNRYKLPRIEKYKKNELLEYDLFDYKTEMPLTNPAEIVSKLDKLFEKSRFA